MAKAKPVNYSYILALFLVVVLLAITYLVYRTYKVEKFEAGAKVTVVLVHASWCPHCTDYIESGIFKKAADAIRANPELAGKVDFREVEYEQNKDKVDKYDVKGFPTIIAVNSRDEKILEFNSFRDSPKPNRNSIADLEEFAKKALNQ